MHAFKTRFNSPAVSEGAVGVGESAEVDVVGGMVPEGTTSDVPNTMCTTCAMNIVTHFADNSIHHMYVCMYKL